MNYKLPVSTDVTCSISLRNLGKLYTVVLSVTGFRLAYPIIDLNKDYYSQNYIYLIKLLITCYKFDLFIKIHLFTMLR